MARLLLKQPTGKWAQFSTVTDSLITWDRNKEEMISIARNEAADEAEVRMLKLMEETDRNSQADNLKAWQQALATHRANYPEDEL